MVYGFVKQPDGHLTIYSEPGHGTTINLYFPAVFCGAEDSGPDAPQSCGVSHVCASRLILIVEDDPRVKRSSQARLAALGFRYLTATSGDAARKILQRRDDIGLVFTDLVMPGTLSGHDLALRITREMPQVRVLMTSGFSEGVLQGGHINAGLLNLRKPYRQLDLIAALQSVLTTR